MDTLLKQLEIQTDRGLPGFPSKKKIIIGEQCYEIYMTKEFRDAYDKLFREEITIRQSQRSATQSLLGG